MARANTFPRRAPQLTDIVGGEDNTGSTPTAGFELNGMQSLLNKRPIKAAPSGYLLAIGDDAFILQSTAPGNNAIAFISAANFKSGTIITVKANEFEVLINPAVGETVEHVTNGDYYCIPPYGSVSFVSDGSTAFYDIGVVRNGLEINQSGAGGNIISRGRFTSATLNTPNATNFVLEVVGGYQNERFIAGDTAVITNISAFAIEVVDNALVKIGPIQAGQDAILVCKTTPGVVAGAGTWKLIPIPNLDQTSNKQKNWGPQDLSPVGTDGAGISSKRSSPALSINYPAGEDRADRAVFVLPPDYTGVGTQLVTFKYTGDVAEVGKSAGLQVQHHIIRPDSGDLLGGPVDGTLLGFQAVPATPFEVVTSTTYPIVMTGAKAGDEVHFMFARIGTNVLDTYLSNIKVTSITYNYN